MKPYATRPLRPLALLRLAYQHKKLPLFANSGSFWRVWLVVAIWANVGATWAYSGRVQSWFAKRSAPKGDFLHLPTAASVRELPQMSCPF